MSALEQKIEDLRSVKKFADKFAGRSSEELAFIRESIISAIDEIVARSAAPQPQADIAETLGLTPRG